MPTYVTLLRFTQTGIAAVKDSPGRIEAGRRAYRAMGAELKQWYLLMGQYDAVVISEAPDDETAARVSLAVGALGNVTTETMRAFDEGEFAAMVAGMP